MKIIIVFICAFVAFGISAICGGGAGLLPVSDGLKGIFYGFLPVIFRIKPLRDG